MIESFYWKNDLLDYAKKFSPMKNPSRLSEKKQASFEKDVVLSFFMIRKLVECHKFTQKTLDHKLMIYRSPCIGRVNNMNFHSIERLYKLESEEKISKDVIFVCNQFIHGGALFAYREDDRNWGGIYTCSDFERKKFIYRIPIIEIVRILRIAGNDYPHSMRFNYSKKSKDYVVEINQV